MPAPFYDDGTQAGPGANSEGAAGAAANNRLNNVTAVTQGAFQLTGGMYGIETFAVGAGAITLQKLAPDGTTWYTAATSTAVGPTLATAQLPPGTYRWLTTGFTAVYATVSRIPQA